MSHLQSSYIVSALIYCKVAVVSAVIICPEVDELLDALLSGRASKQPGLAILANWWHSHSIVAGPWHLIKGQEMLFTQLHRHNIFPSFLDHSSECQLSTHPARSQHLL